jgi:hypothetical protein
LFVKAAPNIPPRRHWVMEMGRPNWVPAQTLMELPMNMEKTPAGLRAINLSPKVAETLPFPRTSMPRIAEAVTKSLMQTEN